MFNPMYNVVHIDEKWFNMCEVNSSFYLTQNEPNPLRQLQHKSHITKVMFLCAVAHPHWDSNGNCIFDGKIGLWPFVKKEPAQRNSKNRAKGSLITKPTVETRDEYLQMLIEKVIPSIRLLWPRNDEKKMTIFIQQDNARPHTNPNLGLFVEVAQQGEFDIRLKCQPPNSPEINVLDLGFFRAIQSLQQQSASTTIDELIENVENSFQNLLPEVLNEVFLTLQACM